MQQAVAWLREADGLLVTAGAGMGVDSGLPDFHGNTGLWRAYPALAEAKWDFQSIANPRAFEDEPALAWGFYGHRLQLYREIEPHPGFAILKRWGEHAGAGRVRLHEQRGRAFPTGGLLRQPNRGASRLDSLSAVHRTLFVAYRFG